MATLLRTVLLCSGLTLLLMAFGCVGERTDPIVLPEPAPVTQVPATPTPTPTMTFTPTPTMEPTPVDVDPAEMDKADAIDESGYWSDFDQSPLHPDGFTVRSALGEMWPRFRPEVSHYAVKCLAGGYLAISEHAAVISSETDGTTVASPELTVDGEPVAMSDGTFGYVRSETDDVDLRIAVHRGVAAAEYTIHCLPGDFPDVSARHHGDPGDTLYAVRPVVGRRLRGDDNWPRWSYMALVDRNGVPRWQSRDTGASTLFKVYSAGETRAVWAERIGLTDDPWNRGRWVFSNYRMVLADADFVASERVGTVGLRHTDAHDVNITPDGNRILLAYEPAMRDLREFGDYSETEPTHDSMVQIVSPEGEVLFQWNSWGKVPIADCVSHRFPPDYAHINSATMAGDDVLVSLRGCHRVMLLDGETGETIWSVGETALGDDEYGELGLSPPLRVVGDPLGRFCGQHSAHLLDGNRLLLFDNQSHCPSAPSYGPYSRAVEYEIDLAAGEARHVREYSMFNAESVLTGSLGTVEVVPGGNWLIGWGRIAADGEHVNAQGRPYASLSEVDPDTGEVIAEMRFSYHPWPAPLKPYPATSVEAVSGAVETVPAPGTPIVR